MNGTAVERQNQAQYCNVNMPSFWRTTVVKT
jgi:hypothetical protein